MIVILGLAMAVGAALNREFEMCGVFLFFVGVIGTSYIWEDDAE